MAISSKRHSQRLNQFKKSVVAGVAHGRATALKVALTVGLSAGLTALVCSGVVAQTNQSNGYRPAYQPQNHELTRGDMAPGVVADIARMSNPQLEGHVQPVRVITPLGSRVGVRTANGYVQANSFKTSVGLKVGPVYRFKVTNIPNRLGYELYPSVEILNRLSPPEGLENEFPIQVLITQSDLEEAIEGRMVTKVVYLEDPETALPHRHLEDKQPYFDIGGSEDPLRVAERLGRPMAILRIGSRVPMPSDVGEQFGFSAPSPTMLPDPQPIPIEGKLKAIEPAVTSVPPMRIPAVPRAASLSRSPAGSPPIVGTQRFANPATSNPATSNPTTIRRQR